MIEFRYVKAPSRWLRLLAFLRWPAARKRMTVMRYWEWYIGKNYDAICEETSKRMMDVIWRGRRSPYWIEPGPHGDEGFYGPGIGSLLTAEQAVIDNSKPRFWTNDTKPAAAYQVDEGKGKPS